MPRIRKYQRGPALTAAEAIAELAAGHYVFERHKPQNPGWVQSWQLGMFLNCCRAGAIFKAEITPEWTAQNNQRQDAAA